MERILKLKQVMKMTGLGKSSLYALLKNGSFPKNVLIGKRSVGWKESEVQSWVNNLPKKEHGHE